MSLIFRFARRPGPLKAPIAATIRRAIYAGQLRPGEALRELHLARELKVSQATIREALVQLEQEGVVVRVPNKGTTVTNFSREEVRERLELRVVLEGMAFTEAANRIDESHFRELSRLAALISAALANKGPHELAQADLRFHRYVWEQSGNHTLLRMLVQLSAPLFAFLGILRRKGVEAPVPTVQPHEALVTALRSRCPEQITATVREHIWSSTYANFLGSGMTDFRQYAQEGGLEIVADPLERRPRSLPAHQPDQGNTARRGHPL
jgi:DNA-binding GntR family transcriptional regulator